MSIVAAGVSSAGFFARSVRRVSDWLWAANLARRTRRELNRLDNHLLADLGMVRADLDGVIEALVAEAVEERKELRCKIADAGRPAAIVDWGTSARMAHLHA